MEVIKLTSEQMERLLNKPGTYQHYQSVFEIYARSEVITQQCGLRYMSGASEDNIFFNPHLYIFQVVDQKKWVYTRLKYSL